MATVGERSPTHRQGLGRHPRVLAHRHRGRPRHHRDNVVRARRPPRREGAPVPRLWRLAPVWVLALLAAVLTVIGTPAHAAPTTSITVDGGQGGRTFDGIGAISGGGGNSRLLTDYPAAQQSADPGLPVQARLRREPAAAEAGDRRRRQLHRRLRAVDRAHPGHGQLQRRLRVLAGRAGQGPQPQHQAVRAGLGRAGLDQRRLLVHRHDQLPDLLAGLRQAARPEHQLPRRLERTRPRRRLVRPAALGAEHRRLHRRADRRRRQRLGRRRRHGEQPGVQQRGLDHRRPLLLRGR